MTKVAPMHQITWSTVKIANMEHRTYQCTLTMCIVLHEAPQTNVLKGITRTSTPLHTTHIKISLSVRLMTKVAPTHQITWITVIMAVRVL
jgi:hypothetical protein